MNDDCLKASLLHPLFSDYPMLTETHKSRLVSDLTVELQEIMDDAKSTEKVTKSKKTYDIENLHSFKKLFGYDDTKGFSGSKSSDTIQAEVILHQARS